MGWTGRGPQGAINNHARSVAFAHPNRQEVILRWFLTLPKAPGRVTTSMVRLDTLKLNSERVLILLIVWREFIRRKTIVS